MKVILGLLVVGLGLWSCSSDGHQIGSGPPPASGLFFDDGGNGDVQGRTESFFKSGADPDELWVISRPAGQRRHTASSPRDLGSGRLLARRSNAEDVPLPLRHTDVHAQIHGVVATVDVEQQFDNPFNGKIEAVYVFPLPHDGAVQEFVMTIGARKIRGVIREREQAEAIYQAARARGHVAALLTEERPNVFTQSVANIEPGHRIDIDIRYFHTVSYDDGWHEFVMPMVVGPRYNASAAPHDGSVNGIGALPRGADPRQGQASNVFYLAPGERSAHTVSVVVDIHAGTHIEEVACHSHRVEATQAALGSVRVALLEKAADRDFVLRYRIAGDRVKSALVTQHDGRGGFFSLMVYPPRHATVVREPVEMILVLDCSGSMQGEPMAQAKQAAISALRDLGPDDSFQVLSFSHDASALGPKMMAATPRNVTKAIDYLSSLTASGGTNMDRGIRAALDMPTDEAKQRVITFLTDGFIGEEKDVLAILARGIGSARLFSFGIGSAPNRHLLEGMARVGRGAVGYVGPNDDAEDVMRRFMARMTQPLLTDLRVTGDVGDLLPNRPLELHAGRPVWICGRFHGPQPNLRVEARGPEGLVTYSPTAKESQGEASLAALWARSKIASLSDGSPTSSRDVEPEMRSLALEFGLMSPVTAFLAVDSMSVTAGDHGTTVPVAVPVPAGVQYSTTVR